MKKLMTVMLGLTLLTGAVPLAVAADDTKKEEKKDKKKKKKGEDQKESARALPFPGAPVRVSPGCHTVGTVVS